MSTLTVYPDNNTGSVTCDALMARQSVDETLGTIIAGAGTNVNATGADNDGPELNSNATTNHYSKLSRTGYGFDTSPLTASASISAAVASFYGRSKDNTFSEAPGVALVNFTPDTNNNFIAGDYDNFGTTEYASRITYASWSTSAYNDFSGNASLLSAINKTGVTNMGLRLSFDLDGSGVTWASNKNVYVGAYFAEQTGTSNDPVLVITYTLTVGRTSRLSLLGVS